MAVTRIDTQDIRDLTIQTQDIADSQVTPGKAFLSASSVWTFQGGLSGSIQQTAGGLSYIVAGSGITVTSASNGQITIDAVGGNAPADAKYLVMDLNGTLTNERVLTPGLGITGSDSGPNGALTLAADPTVVAFRSGTSFTGAVQFNAGLSGSLQQTQAGVSYLVAGTNIAIVTGANGQVTISAADALSGLVSFDDFVFGEIPSGLVNGSNTIFTASQTPAPSVSLQVYKNGMRMLSGSSNDYILSGNIEGGLPGRLIVFQAGSVPTTNSTIQIDYQLEP